MTEQHSDIKFQLSGGRQVVLRFTKESDQWVCRTGNETMGDLVRLTQEEQVKLNDLGN